MKRWLAFAPIALLALIVVASAFVLLRPGTRETVSEGDLGRLAPAFSLARLGGGEQVRSVDFEGRPHLVNFFASWCAPCRVEHPELMRLRQQGVEIIGIAYKDEPEAAGRFLAELGNPFSATALDPEGRFALDMGVAGAVPETFVLDGEGRIRLVYRGALTDEVINEQILPALNSP